jgi:hypothetical protein
MIRVNGTLNESYETNCISSAFHVVSVIPVIFEIPEIPDLRVWLNSLTFSPPVLS